MNPNRDQDLVIASVPSLIDGTGGPIAEDVAVEIAGGRVRSVSKDGSPASTGSVVDADGLTIMPGIIDAHTHMGHAFESSVWRDTGSLSVAEMVAEILANLSIALDSGVTTARELGGLDGGMARAIERGMVRGPRLFPSGPALAQTGGHGTYLGQFPSADTCLQIPGLIGRTVVVDGVEEVRKAARLAFRRGATQLKVYASGGVLSEGDSITDSQFSVSELSVMVEEARARGTYVTGHAHSLAALENCLDAGIRCFEHGTFLDSKTADAILEVGGAIVPTLTVLHVMEERAGNWGIPPSMLYRLDGVEAAMAESIALAHERGIMLGSGSDLLGANQTGRGMEIALKAAIIGPMDALVSATRNNAIIMGIENEVGTIQVDRVADIIGVAGNPIEQPDLLSHADNVRLVIQKGRVVKDADGRLF